MLTIREARTRCAVHAMRLQRTDCGEFRVSFMERTGCEAEDSAYYTDDLDDAVHTAAAMRRRAANPSFDCQTARRDALRARDRFVLVQTQI